MYDNKVGDLGDVFKNLRKDFIRLFFFLYFKEVIIFLFSFKSFLFIMF